MDELIVPHSEPSVAPVNAAPMNGTSKRGKEKTMTEPIDKTEAMRRLKAAYDGSVAVHGDNDNLFADGIDYAMDIVRNIKAADAIPVIRCKDCKYSRELNREDPNERQFIEDCVWCMNWEYGVFPDDYCSNAKRKENSNGD